MLDNQADPLTPFFFFKSLSPLSYVPPWSLYLHSLLECSFLLHLANSCSCFQARAKCLLLLEALLLPDARQN